jgi:hypothetical protein
MEEYIITFISLMMPFLLALYGRYVNEKYEEIVVETRLELKSYLRKFKIQED